MTDVDVPLVHLPGSEREPAPGLRPASAPLPADGTVEATVVLRRRAPLPAGARLDPTRLAEEHGAEPAEVELVARTFTELGFTVLARSVASRRVRIRGSVGQAERAFSTRLTAAVSPTASGEVEHRARSGGLSIPAQLDGVVTAVLGLDDRPQARTKFRVAAPRTVRTSYTPLELGGIYRFPEGTDGTGQTVAILELGGGYRQADLDTYFSGLGVGSPRVRAVGVDGGRNAPTGDGNGADGEVLLDIEVVGALAPAAQIVVYFAPNSDAGFLDALAEAAHATPAPAAISISWGQSEDQWTAQARTAMDDAVQDAVALGVAVTAAAGDNGSGDGEDDGEDHVDFPASSPSVLACGGTSLHASGGMVGAETVWNNGAGGGATGGGVSVRFPKPEWQQDAGVPAPPGNGGGRGVPDVAGVADPETGYEVLIDGQRTVIGGTSAVAPLWAALIARIAQELGPQGLLHPRLYAARAGFRDVTSGDNGGYRARSGWDACTGLGVPDGAALLEVLRTTSA
jgi:kumamolisin